jgi:hypothetical protein
MATPTVTYKGGWLSRPTTPYIVPKTVRTTTVVTVRGQYSTTVKSH